MGRIGTVGRISYFAFLQFIKLRGKNRAGKTWSPNSYNFCENIQFGNLNTGVKSEVAQQWRRRTIFFTLGSSETHWDVQPTCPSHKCRNLTSLFGKTREAFSEHRYHFLVNHLVHLGRQTRGERQLAFPPPSGLSICCNKYSIALYVCELTLSSWLSVSLTLSYIHLSLVHSHTLLHSTTLLITWYFKPDSHHTVSKPSFLRDMGERKHQLVSWQTQLDDSCDLDATTSDQDQMRLSVSSIFPLPDIPTPEPEDPPITDFASLNIVLKNMSKKADWEMINSRIP